MLLSLGTTCLVPRYDIDSSKETTFKVEKGPGLIGQRAHIFPARGQGDLGHTNDATGDQLKIRKLAGNSPLPARKDTASCGPCPSLLCAPLTVTTQVLRPVLAALSMCGGSVPELEPQQCN